MRAEETRECREQEYKDRFGNCKPCKQCDAGQELSKVRKQKCYGVFNYPEVKHYGARSVKKYFVYSAAFSAMPLRGRFSIVTCVFGKRKMSVT